MANKIIKIILGLATQKTTGSLQVDCSRHDIRFLSRRIVATAQTIIPPSMRVIVLVRRMVM